MWSNYLLVIVLIICVITDIKERKIYNSVLFPCLLAALILHSITGGFIGLKEGLLGMTVGLSILIIPYLLGGMGAGDVKLLAVIGGIKGIPFVIATSIFMAIAGGIMAIIVILFRKGFKNRWARITMFLHGLFNGMRISIIDDKDVMKSTYPYGVAIAAGAICQAFRAGGFPI